MKTAVTNIIILLQIISGLTSGTGFLPDDVLNAAVGGTVTFITSVSPSEKTPLTVTWDFIDNNSNTINIIISVSDYTSPQYVDRITFFRSTGSLELRNLALTDSGQYQVNVVLTGPSIPGQTTLNVLVPVSNVTVTVSDTDLVEFNSSVSLSCSSSGSSLFFLWLNGSSEVTATDRVQLSDQNRTITIVNVSRYDQGPFRCRVSNAVSNKTSEPVKLTISSSYHSEECGRLSPAAITRIVIACVLVFGGVSAGGLCICVIEVKLFYFSRSDSSVRPHKTEHKEPVYENNHVAPQASSLAPETSG